MARKIKKTKNKIKTKRGAAKRFKLSGDGKVRFRRAGRNHIKTKQSNKRVRDARRNGVMCTSDEVLVHRMLNQ